MQAAPLPLLTDPQLTSTHWNGSRGFRNAAPEPISALGQPFVRRDGPLEVVVCLAGNEAEIFQRRQVLLGLGGLAKHQIGLAEMLMRAAVAGIQNQRLLVMANSRPQLTQSPIGIADVVLDIGIK